MPGAIALMTFYENNKLMILFIITNSMELYNAKILSKITCKLYLANIHSTTLLGKYSSNLE